MLLVLPKFLNLRNLGNLWIHRDCPATLDTSRPAGNIPRLV
jgi:hypothetical protein